MTPANVTLSVPPVAMPMSCGALCRAMTAMKTPFQPKAVAPSITSIKKSSPQGKPEIPIDRAMASVPLIIPTMVSAGFLCPPKALSLRDPHTIRPTAPPILVTINRVPASTADIPFTWTSCSTR